MTAVHGLCAGGAMYFLNESDIIICSDDAVFFDPHANVGIVSALEPIGMLIAAFLWATSCAGPSWATRSGSLRRRRCASASSPRCCPRAELRDRAREIAW